MVKNTFKFLSLALLIIIASCAKNMDEAFIPSYIKIDKIDVLTTGEQGSSASYITDAWVYVDGADLGAFPLPAVIPILASGNHVVKIAPGIKLNGVGGTRVPYPMVEPVETNIELIKDTIQTMVVSSNYYSSSIFSLIDDFENANVNLEPTSLNTAEWRRSHTSTDPQGSVFEGHYSGIGILNNNNTYFQIMTRKNFEDLPSNGAPAFIEMNFKTNTTIVLGIMSYLGNNGESTDLIYLNPTKEWKKIYINLTSSLVSLSNKDYFKFIISANHTNGDEQTIVLIDNFKVIYREIE